MRTEFGFPRSSCGCNDCKTNCRFMPGFLIPADLERLIPPGVDPFRWAERNLLASPGALAMKDGQIFRIRTLVPATKSGGACKHLTDEGLCAIHEAAPFGCAFFDCQTKPEHDALSQLGLKAVMEAWNNNGLYASIWKYLNAQGRRQKTPDELRARMRAAI